MVRGSTSRKSQRQRLFTHGGIERNEPINQRTPVGKRSGLVEGHHPGLCEALQRPAVAKQYLILRRGAERRPNGHGGREPQRTRASDQHDGQTREQSGIDAVEPCVEGEGPQCNDEHQREKHRGQSIGQLFVPSLLQTGLANAIEQTSPRAAARRSSDFDRERAVEIQGTADDQIARFTDLRPALAGEKLGVDRSDTRGDSAVARNSLAGANH